MKKRTFLTTILIFSVLSVAARKAERIEALDSSLWKGSMWISVADAPVVAGPAWGSNIRAADGANWFVSKIVNQGKVVSAKWMATSLGVHDIYVNGILVGEEVLKPGFTDPQKTKRSFTYPSLPSKRIWYQPSSVFSMPLTCFRIASFMGSIHNTPCSSK